MSIQVDPGPQSPSRENGVAEKWQAGHCDWQNQPTGFQHTTHPSEDKGGAQDLRVPFGAKETAVGHHGGKIPRDNVGSKEKTWQELGDLSSLQT